MEEEFYSIRCHNQVQGYSPNGICRGNHPARPEGCCAPLNSTTPAPIARKPVARSVGACKELQLSTSLLIGFFRFCDDDHGGSKKCSSPKFTSRQLPPWVSGIAGTHPYVMTQLCADFFFHFPPCICKLAVIDRPPACFSGGEDEG